MMCLSGSPGIIVKTNPKIFKGFFNDPIVFINYILRSYSFFLRFDGNRHTVLVTTTNKGHIVPLHSKKAGINICRNINAG